MNTEKAFTPALGYDFLTDWYDLAIKLTMPERKFRRLLVDQIDPQPGEKILEFGFGTGANLLLVKEKCPDTDLHGLDIDPKVRAIAAQKLAKFGLEIPLELYDSGIFPFADGQFDKVYSCLVFHQLDENEKAACLREIHRVLKKGGKLIIADWGKAAHLGMRLAFGLVQLLDGFKTTNANVNGRLPGFICEAGFLNVAEVKSINTLIGTFSYFTADKI
ncbi:MAG: class I SAM-dependent methyltransferase [Saprospiraceae bacterium]|nr:class I SAM-dependent methyltransferase [Saprospiraceae bacterium]